MGGHAPGLGRKQGGYDHWLSFPDIGGRFGQRVFRNALGYKDFNDHDKLRQDPMMAILVDKLAARRKDESSE